MQCPKHFVNKLSAVLRGSSGLLTHHTLQWGRGQLLRMAHRAQRVRSLGSGVFLLSRINTSTKFQETVVYKKLNAKNLILILNMWFSILLKWLIGSKRKHQKEKVFGKYKDLPLASFEFITEFFLPATTLCIFIMDARTSVLTPHYLFTTWPGF